MRYVAFLALSEDLASEQKRKRTGWDAYTLICTGAPCLEGTGFIKWGLKTKNRLTK